MKVLRLICVGLLVLSSCQLYSQLQFTNVASTTGLGHSYGTSMFGGGISFVDFDGDGWDDITLATNESEKVYFLKNNGGSFTAVDLQGITDKSRAKHVLWVDYDNDGDKDFFVTNFFEKNRLYRNDGNLQFTDITNTCGIFTDPLASSGATFGDMDNDGDLDLFITTWEQDNLATDRNYLYRNDNGTFVDVTVANGIDTFNELSLGATFLDYDNDGDQDIYMINDRNIYQNRLYQNDGSGNFTDVSTASGTDIFINAMSTGIGDYNADGFPDIYVTNTPEGNALLHNNGDGTFTNKASDTGTSFNSFGWGSVFLDADNDSYLDLYVSGPFDGSVPSLLPSAFYHNNGQHTFTIPSNIGLNNDNLQSFANAIGDYNNDGIPDIAVMNDDEVAFLWSNTAANSNKWLKVKLKGVTGNKDGIGNKIEVRANGQSQFRFTVCGEGYLGQNSNTEFFGLANAASIEYVKVTWHSTGVTETITNAQLNQTITIEEGNGVLSSGGPETIGFSIYPNPSASGRFHISSNIQDLIEVLVMDTQGKQILKTKISDKFLDLSQVQPGIYFLRLKTKQKTVVQKVIKN